MLGPGVAPDGRPLWTPDAKDIGSMKISLFADLTPKGKFDPKKAELKAREKPPTIEVRRDNKVDDRRKQRDERDLKLDTSDNLFEDEKDHGTKAIPQPNLKSSVSTPIATKSREDRELERKFEQEQRLNKDKEKEIRELEDKVKRYQNQLYEKETDRSRVDKSFDSKNTHYERERNRKDLEEKYQQKFDQMKKDYELKMERMELDYEKKLTRVDRERGTKSPSQHLPYASNYLADPSQYAPSYYPPDDKGRLIGQSRYVDEDLKILPPPPQVPIELPTAFDLTRDDEMTFIKLGIKDEILRHNTYDEPELEIELKNPLKASEFAIRFIAFKPPLAMPFGQNVPRRMYFRFNFFTFSETISEA